MVLPPGLAIFGLVSGLLAGCADSRDDHWTRVGVTPTQSESDSRACKRAADEHAMRRVHQPDRAVPGGGFGVDPMAQVDQAEARRAYRAYYESCMEARGDRP
jgi:hypothetical protein